MKHNALALALVAAATGVPATAHAADDVCSRLFIYAVNQFCQLLPNGQNLCQPIGLAGPSPNCEAPGQAAMVQVPLGPPAIQFPAYNPAASAYNANPYMQNPFAMNPFGVNPYAVNPYGLPPFPFVPGAFPPAANYTPPPIPQSATPTPPVAQAPADTATTPPVAATGDTASAPETLTKLMPEAVTPPTPPAQQVAASPQIVATETVTVATSAVSPLPAAAPESVADTANTDLAAAEAAKSAAEQARQDALAHFEFDSADLTPAGRAMLDEWLTQASSKSPILVTGHADRLGPEPYNNKLSQLRAESVRKYLVEKGMPAARIQIQAKGEHMPIISCAGDANPETKSCLAPNRRAEVTVKPAVKRAAKAAAKPAVKSAAKGGKTSAGIPAKTEHITQK